MKKNVLIFTLFFVVLFVSAETVTITSGAGSAVTTPDRVAYFSSITEGISLSNYTENLLSITTPGVAHLQFDPTYGSGLGGFIGGFFYPSGGTNGCNTIKTTDLKKIYALEFNVGHGFGGTSVYVHWEAVRNSTIVASGYLTATAGQVLGFQNALGMDEFRFGGYTSLSVAQTATASTYQAGALDNLKVSLAGVPVPEPATWLMLLSVFSLFSIRIARK